MSSFINEDFLLENESARRLYHGFAEGFPWWITIIIWIPLPSRPMEDFPQ
jgi:hypothetical protein